MQVHRRVLLAVGTNGLGQRQGPIAYRRVDHPQVQRPAQFTLERGGVLLEAVHFRQQAQGFLMEQLTLTGQAEAPSPAMAQHDTQRRLQLTHVSADG
ncbi:hypothetical protein D3C72_2167790 [compost metagenome]